MDRANEFDAASSDRVIRDLISEVAKTMFSAAKYYHWINGDMLCNGLARRILQIRLGEGGQSLQPIFIYGFQPFDQIIRNEREYPRLLVSPGVGYLYLPIAIDHFQHLVNTAVVLTDRDMSISILKEYAADSQMSRLESMLAHDAGNFLGYKHLLYGAYLNRMIDWTAFQEICAEVQRQQEHFLPKVANDPEYRLYLTRDSNYSEGQGTDSESETSVKGRLLYIDDHGSLGWGQAVAAALYGQCEVKESKKKEWPEGICYQYHQPAGDRKSGLLVLGNLFSAKGNELGREDSYLKAVETFIETQPLEDYDLILLDLRLMWRGDETACDISGIEVLKKIRAKNGLIPIIVLTASRRALNMRAVLDAGADAYVVKDLPSFSYEKERSMQYHADFIGKIKSCLEFAYVRHAWGYFTRISVTNIRSHININEEILLEETRSQIKKSLALLKILPSKFSFDTLQLRTLNEAIVALNECQEAVKKATETTFPFKTPSWMPEALLFGIRSLCVHGAGEEIDEQDVKAALFLVMRLFVAAEQLLGLAKILFDYASPAAFDRSFKKRVDKELVKIAEKKGLFPTTVTYTKTKLEYTISKRDDGIEIDSFGNKAQFNYGFFWRRDRNLRISLNFSDDKNPLFKLCKDKKRAHYLLALSRMNPQDLEECDRVFLGHLAKSLRLAQ